MNYTFSGFSKAGNAVVRGAIAAAQDMGHTYVGTEHLLLALVRAFFAAADARREQKAAIREENERLAREAQEAAEATQAEPDPRVPAAPEASPQEPVPQAALEPAADSTVETPVPENEQPQG